MKTSLFSAQINLIQLQNLGIAPYELITHLPSYEDIPWDLYDVRREELVALGIDICALPPAAKDYYLGNIFMSELLSRMELDAIELNIKPYRKKSVCFFELYHEDGKWQFHPKPTKSIEQNVRSTDIRNLQRSYSPLRLEESFAPYLDKLAAYLGNTVREYNTDVRSLNITMWQVRTYTYAGDAKTNAPEGIHQDGADYVVSALVLDRNNITAGESQIYLGAKETLIYSRTLQIGEGLFQPDDQTDLWHTVTPIEVVDTTLEYGYRDILGFDIYCSR